MALLEVKNIKKNFGKTEVLKGIDFSLEEGQVLAIIGSSGSGKTTLLRCLNFLEQADEGMIRVGEQTLFDGSDKVTLSDEAIRQNRLNFGLVFQNFNLFPQYTALQNVTLAPTLLKKGTAQEIEDNARNLLDKVGLSDKLGNYPNQLSGGQQQRVAIARALVNKPSIILADEPTGNLDSDNGNHVMELMIDSVKKYGKSMLVITHDKDLTKMATKVLVLKDGKIVQNKEMSE